MHEWLNEVSVHDWPELAEGINIGFLEWTDSGFEAYVAFCPRFDAAGQDWPCEELDEVDYRYAQLPKNKGALEWDEFDNLVAPIIQEWVNGLKRRHRLSGIKGIAHGFDAGDLTLVYRAGV